MSLHVQGIAWVSPIARGIDNLIAVLHQPTKSMDKPPLTLTKQLRLRRSGRISQLALTAVMDALVDANKEPTAQTALIFLSTHGGICHTIRFFESVTAGGTHAGSPIFFPETVYNAPPSYIAAHFGINGMVTSFVGDSAAVGGAICTAEEWISTGLCDQCIIVSAEEIHPLLQDAYHCLRLGPGRFGGAPLSEAAAAILLSYELKGSAIRAHPGAGIKKRSNLLPVLFRILKETAASDVPDMILTSALGREAQTAERTAVAELWPHINTLYAKARLGESFAASSLGAIVIGEALLRLGNMHSVLISLPGGNGQVSAVFLNSGNLSKEGP